MGPAYGSGEATTNISKGIDAIGSEIIDATDGRTTNKDPIP